MRILWVKAGGLIPPDTGGKIRSYNILRELARRHSVTFFSYYAAAPNDTHPKLKSVFDAVVCVPLQLPAPKSLAESLEYGTRFFSSQPYGISKYCRPEAQRQLRHLLEEKSYDIIICDFIFAAGVIPWDCPIPKVLFTHNVEAMIWRRHYEVARNPVWRAISRWEWRKMEAAEKHYLRLADRVLTVSETDKDAFAAFLDRQKITVIPTGVDVEYFHPAAVDECPNSLVFTGSMDWLPNEDGILYFSDAIFPLIKQECPDATLTVVGRKPSRKLQSVAKADKSIRLTGWVDDIRPFLVDGAVCIVPLRIGGGTRLKIFEAMAMAKAVVSTSVGAEGLPVQNQEDVILADSPGEFASAVVSLLRDPAKRKRFGGAARVLVEQNYSWRKVAEDFAATLQEVIEQHAERALHSH
jgi:polysaccharide biosynthesis protein PslH